MKVTDFKYDIGSIVVVHVSGSGQFQVVGRGVNSVTDSLYYDCAPLKADGSINKRIKSFRFDEENILLADCQEKSSFCNGKNVRLVQMKSSSRIARGGNEYNGKILRMCAGCRSGQNGQFKMVTDEA